MLLETVYHETSLVKFRDEVTHNMPVCVQPPKSSRDYYMQYHLAKTEKTGKCDSSKIKIRCISRLFLNDEQGFYILHKWVTVLSRMRRMHQASKRIRIRLYELISLNTAIHYNTRIQLVIKI